MRIEKLQKHFQIDVNLVHFPLHPETPKEGIPIKELYAGRNLDPEEMHKNMKIRMDAEGLPYGKRTHTYNSRNAQELGKWADTQNNGETWESKYSGYNSYKSVTFGNNKFIAEFICYILIYFKATFIN